MSLPPVVASLTRHRLTALLLVLQVSLTCAIVCNVAFMIANRTTQLRQPSGIAENELVMIDSTDLDNNAQPLVRHATDLAALRAIAGVTSAAAVDALPFNLNDWSNGIALVPDAPSRAVATAFNGTPGELTTIGLHLIEGRDFLPNEYVPLDSAHDWAGIDRVPVVIVTRALAEQLFPGQSPLGKAIYPDEKPVRIVGVVDRMAGLAQALDHEFRDPLIILDQKYLHGMPRPASPPFTPRVTARPHRGRDAHPAACPATYSPDPDRGK